MTTIHILISVMSLLATLGVFGALYKIGLKIGATDQRLTHIEHTLEKLPCANNEALIQQSRHDITTITTFLLTRFPTSMSIFGQKSSPTQLNGEGDKLYADIDGSMFLEIHRAYFLQKMERKSPSTALDVETSALDVLIEDLHTEKFKPIKQWVYHAPEREIFLDGTNKRYAVTLQDVCFVISIHLRDSYLKAHPELL